MFFFVFFQRSHILEVGESYRDKMTSQSQSSECHSVLSELDDKSLGTSKEEVWGGDRTVGEDQQPGNEGHVERKEQEFEARLQYAMEQSLVLQNRQLRDIENLQENLGDDKSQTSTHDLKSGKLNKGGKHNKPVK